MSRAGRWRAAAHRRSLLAATGALLSACQTLMPAPPTAVDLPGASGPLPAAWAAAPREASKADGAGQAGGQAPLEVAAEASPTPAMPDDERRLRRWWPAWQDATLGALVQQALQSNLSIASAEAGLRQARALRDQAQAGDALQLGASASAQAGLTRPDGGPSSRSRGLGLGVDAGWEPDLFGGTRAAVAAASASAEASRYSLADVQVSVAAETALAYLQLRALQARAALARENLASQRETLQITDWRRQAGLASELELEQARSAVAQTAASLPALETSLAQTAHALAVLTGQPPAALQALRDTPAALPTPPLALALHIPAETLRQRPDVRQSEAALAAAAARVDQAEAARRPSLRLSGDIGLSALALGPLLSAPTLAGTLLAGLSLPLLDGGALRAQVRAQAAALDAARSAHRASVLGALQEVEDALVAVQGGGRQLEQQRLAAASARRAAELASQRWRSGLADFQTVLSTQRTQLTAQDAEASAALSLASAQVRLYKALGGGWDPQAPSP